MATIVRRCYWVLIGLARMQRRIPRETKRLLVETLVFSHLCTLLYIRVERMHSDTET